MERDSRNNIYIVYMMDFNSHAHVERDVVVVVVVVDDLDFNSHAHVERDNFYLEMQSHKSISTHTLTWSVT